MDDEVSLSDYILLKRNVFLFPPFPHTITRDLSLWSHQGQREQEAGKLSILVSLSLRFFSSSFFYMSKDPIRKTRMPVNLDKFQR